MENKLTIVHDYPPNFEIIKAVLPHASDRFVYCYGDKVYVPDGHEVTPDILFHESIHARQQGNDPDVWWKRYLTDRGFRLNQEVEAYGEQYAWLCAHVKGSNAFKKWALSSMADALSGVNYEGLMSYGAAESAIKRYARNKT